MPDEPSDASSIPHAGADRGGAKTYDAVPYHGQPFPQMHPASIAAVARLLGLPAADPATCRVLELGCCDGGHLIPLAEQLPGATFVGIDYSPRQIEMGRARVDALGLKNITLRPVSITDIGPDYGAFDYIVTHGVFSWVPDVVRDATLDVCARHLAPDGIAYVSYNTYPGWHLRGIVRDMMRYHATRFPEPRRQVQEARLILDFVANFSTGHNAEAYGTFLKSEAELLKKLPDHYLFHEHLEENCNPYYFKDFVGMARARGLDYLSESRIAAMAPTNLGAEVERGLAAISTDLVELEQFMDYLRNRTFRETLLHRAGPARTPNYTLQPATLKGLWLASSLRPKAQPLDLRAGVDQAFETDKGHPVSSANPIVKAALFCLALAYPSSIGFEALVHDVLGQLRKYKVAVDDATPDKAAAALGRALLTLLTGSDAVEVRAAPSAFTLSPGQRPVASPYARLQAPEHEPITTRRHESAALDEPGRAVLKLLDGTRTIADVARESGTDEGQAKAQVERLGRMAMLIG